MISWGRLSKMSLSVTFPLEPSKTYSLSISTIGRLRRSMLRASRVRVSSFSFCSSSRRAARHSSREAIRGRVIRFRLPRIRELIGQKGHLHARVPPQVRGSGQCLRAESLVDLVEGGVEGVGVVVERQGELHGAVVVEGGH